MINTKQVQTAKKKLIEMHFHAGVGHIGGNLSCIDAMLVIWHEFIKKNDFFILSKGHSAGSLYITLNSIGEINDNQLRSFHSDNTILPGHPPVNKFQSIPFATGSLGHGLSISSGLALASKIQKNKNKIFCFTSDGEWQAGSIWESLLFIEHQKLSNLTIIVDQNKLQGLGKIEEISSLKNLALKLKNFNFSIVQVDGHNLPQIRKALKINSLKPKIIILRTIKGNGISFMENQMKWHYLPLTKELYKQAIKELSNEK